MKITMEQVKSDEGKTVAFAVNMTCRNEDEFRTAYEHIKGVDGVEWVGCPVETDRSYWDMIAYIEKGDYTVLELREEARRIAKECKAVFH